MYSSVKKFNKVLSSVEIRKTFLDYFTINHDHKFVRSSPVVPFGDPTVAFVNAGMNQFKSTFLGKTQAPYKRVCNSQKCVRVGGKHNDLSIVGQDSYHHTFFEMLGNWSFGDYFKFQACQLALDLLRGPYNIDTRRLYVTYFAGDKELGLPSDIECFEIWRSLGIPVSRILPFGVKDNFWEMGTTGPCGPCTEIHIDHHPDLLDTNRGNFVNKGLSDITELWNIVFIQYNRNADGSITQLPEQHVDTGMGFERLTAILQNKYSNYDTDLFVPLFERIQKETKRSPYGGCFLSNAENNIVDTGYRILADHSRMISICLADGMLPDHNQKLRRVMRKVFTVSENTFSNENLLLKLIPVVVETLGSVYPELYSKQCSVLEIVAHEQDVFRKLRMSSSKAFTEILAEYPKLEYLDLIECPGFVPAYRDFKTKQASFQNNTIPGSFLYKLTDTYGLSEDDFGKFAEIDNMLLDEEGYRNTQKMEKFKTKSIFYPTTENEINRTDEAFTKITKILPPTNDIHKYNYTYDLLTLKYNIPNVKAKVIGILYNANNILQSVVIPSNEMIYIITNSSNFFSQSGGQQSDKGKMLVPANNGITHELDIFNVKNLNNCVIHACKSLNTEIKLAIGTNVEIIVDAEHRTLNSHHHTGVHLLNEAIRTLYNKTTYQVSSDVTKDYFKLEVGLIGKRIQREDVEDIETLIGTIICSAIPVNVQLITAADVLEHGDITMVPGETYPDTNLRLLSIISDRPHFRSKELCCGTHVLNTQELQHLCITNLKQTNRAHYAFTGVAGSIAKNAIQTSAIIKQRVESLEEQFSTDMLTNATEMDLQNIRQILNSDVVIPYTFRLKTLETINGMLKKLKDNCRISLKEFVEMEMKNLLNEQPFKAKPFILHYISSSALVEEVPLQRATKLCKNYPILVVGMCNRIIKARCCVPKEYITYNFNAELWLNEFSTVFKSRVAPPKGQSCEEVCNMKAKKVSTNFEEQLEAALDKAEKFAERNCSSLESK